MKYLFTTYFLIFCGYAFAQSVAINNQTFLPVSQQQADAIYSLGTLLIKTSTNKCPTEIDILDPYLMQTPTPYTTQSREIWQAKN